ncbi:hypothetical protein KAFR_0F01270 [Kazachstania africana CBS 2517]|uniref:Lon protease homolog n=1 Tax=Kazachstania africana (strain ATCC 22294 / BCRC 22015 / CBS 2517 / CECT 1963 / NBRC 1671 / NRRL Y-8276) TaxID=1071382 RepID=H2AWH3_KAZAF|nr:hypothetical protein KAFR_0F01270 [Kazachstania africana CBS 2517]CCF58723.1 hypothetical protein KAFR_0F01270 [Kazachstania africana CBS 2517]
MLFKKPNMCTEFVIPCFTLNSVPSVVVLPGVLCDITLTKSLSDSLLTYLNMHKEDATIDAHIVSKISDQCKVIQPGKGAQKVPDNKDRFYICLLPANNSKADIGCICAIEQVSYLDGSTTKVSFMALQRARVKEPLLNSGDNFWLSPVSLYDEFSILTKTVNTKDVLNMAMEIIKTIDMLEVTLTKFNNKYKTAANSGNSQEHYLLLSPLSNALFFQLNSEQFNRSWSHIRVEAEALKSSLVLDAPTESNLTNFGLIDILTTVLPISKTFRLDILNCLEIRERFTTFEKIVKYFFMIFANLYDSTEYIRNFYSNANTLEKANLIANQLKSLKIFIEDVKANNTAVASNSGNKMGRLLAPTSKNQQIRTERTKNYAEEEEDYEEEEDDDFDELKSVKRFIKKLPKLNIHPDGKKLLVKDYKRLMKMSFQKTNSEYQQLRNYFDIIMDIPFDKFSKEEKIDISNCKSKLDVEHFGLLSVKKRLLEYLSVLKLNQLIPKNQNKCRPPILLLVGPPGVGKTSIVRSIASVLNRKYQRISLGGVYNEADIRGHRRTYVGAMCGSIINALRKASTMNPLILLDEIDKIGTSPAGRTNTGDPSSALLETLDFEQNFSFMDHYVGLPIDLSQVLFICTANDLSTISRPLLDRMEVIKIPGYTLEEKIEIGSKFLLPKQIKQNGLNQINGAFNLDQEAWESLVSGYTREPGVRNLERQIAKIVRGKVVEYIEDPRRKESKTVDKQELHKYLGFPLHPITKELLSDIPWASKEGIVNGLSYNSDGTGSVLIFEIVRTGPCKGSHSGPVIKSTGNLGNVLQESIDIGCSLVKTIIRRGLLGDVHKSNVETFFTSEYHLHAPMGSIQKDGPSAGMAITMALLSLATGRPIDPTLCMTGEITLRGKVLPIGGLKQKLLGAKMYGMKRVLVPYGNKQDVIESITDDIDLFMKSSNQNEIHLVHDKMGLSLAYVNNIYEAIAAIWPDLSLEGLTTVHKVFENNFKSKF